MKVFNYEPYHEFILNEYNSQQEKNYTKIAKKLIKEYDLDLDPENARRVIGRIVRSTVEECKESSNDTKEESKAKPFIMSAWKQSGGVMNIDEYCEHHGLPRDDVRSYKLVSHTGIPFYNVQFRETALDSALLDAEYIKSFLIHGFNFKVHRNKSQKECKNIGVIKIADLHFGALVDNLIRTPDFNSNILAEKLLIASEKINQNNFDAVHLHIHGDLIESFTGLSHINSWKSMDVKLIGANAVKGCVKMLHEFFLSKINNLVDIKIVAGNHDRVSSNNKEDEDGDAANLISWGLGLIGYDVEFNSNIISHEVDGINHIIIHGHNIVSKRPTKDIIWDYGKQGIFNLVVEGHLHSLIEKLTVSQLSNFKTTKDDSVDHRRIVCPSFFTGNSYSEKLNFFSHSGFMIITAYDGKPEISYKII